MTARTDLVYNWFPDRLLLESFQKGWEDDTLDHPMITRYLTQEQLHQLVVKLITRMSSEVSLYIDSLGADSYLIERLENLSGWSIWNYMGERSKLICKTVECIEKVIDKIPIETVHSDYRGERSKIYDYYYIFYHSPEQEEVLSDFLPEIDFDYPSGKIAEKDYLKQLRKTNKSLKKTLAALLGKDAANIVSSYRPSPEQIKRRYFLESKLPQGNIVADYLN